MPAVATTFDEWYAGYTHAGMTVEDGVIAARALEAWEAATAGERGRWAKAVERLEMGESRRGWLAEAEQVWDARFGDAPRPDGELIWVTRCRELLREMAALQADAAFLRTGEGS